MRQSLPRRRYDLAIERGLEASRTLVLCLSQAALGPDWVGLERSDPANAGRRPIRRPENEARRCEPVPQK